MENLKKSYVTQYTEIKILNIVQEKALALSANKWQRIELSARRSFNSRKRLYKSAMKQQTTNDQVKKERRRKNT